MKKAEGIKDKSAKNEAYIKGLQQKIKQRGEKINSRRQNMKAEAMRKANKIQSKINKKRINITKLEGLRKSFIKRAAINKKLSSKKKPIKTPDQIKRQRHK